MNGIGPAGPGGGSTGAMSQLRTAMEQLSTGKKLNSASDNAAGIAVAVELASGLGGLQQAGQNVGDALGVLQTAEGGLGSISDSLIRMRELSVQASNSTLNASQRDMIQAELDGLAESVNQVAGSTEFNGTNLLDGSSPTLTFQVGANNTPADQLEVDFQDVSAGTLGVGALSSASTGSAQAGIDAVDAALDQVSTFRAEIGAASNQLLETSENIQSAIVAQSDSLSRVQDTDVGEAASSLAAGQVLLQAQIAMQVQGNAQQSNVLRLIG